MRVRVRLSDQEREGVGQSGKRWGGVGWGGMGWGVRRLGLG